MKKTNNYFPEVRECPVRFVLENVNGYPSEWATIESIAAKIGCAPQMLHSWVRKYQIDQGHRPGQTTKGLSALRREG